MDTLFCHVSLYRPFFYFLYNSKIYYQRSGWGHYLPFKMRHSGFFSQLSIDMHTCISRVSNNFFRFNYFGSRKGSGSWDKHFATLTPLVNFVLKLGKNVLCLIDPLHTAWKELKMRKRYCSYCQSWARSMFIVICQRQHICFFFKASLQCFLF